MNQIEHKVMEMAISHYRKCDSPGRARSTTNLSILLRRNRFHGKERQVSHWMIIASYTTKIGSVGLVQNLLPYEHVNAHFYTRTQEQGHKHKSQAQEMTD